MRKYSLVPFIGAFCIFSTVPFACNNSAGPTTPGDSGGFERDAVGPASGGGLASGGVMDAGGNPSSGGVNGGGGSVLPTSITGGVMGSVGGVVGSGGTSSGSAGTGGTSPVGGGGDSGMGGKGGASMGTTGGTMVGSGGKPGVGGATVGAGGATGGTGGATGGSGGALSSTGGAIVGTGGVLSGTGGRTVGTGGATGGTASGAGGSAASSGGAPGAGGSCSTPPSPSELVGWATVSGNGVSSTTGGGSSTPTTATTLTALQAAVKGTSAAVIYVKGILSAGTLSVGSNKTIVGLCGAEIHGHVEMTGSVNVIMRNIKIVGYGVGNCALDPSYDASVGCSSGEDAISLQKNSHHVWFDHCDISDGTDGNLDITNAADFVTVSWTKFHYTPRTDTKGSDSTGASGHRFSNLVGGTDSPSGNYDDSKTLNVTWHHNWWADNAMERMPRVRFGKNHIYSNLFSSTGNSYCVRAGKQAQVLVESNVFVGVNSPQEFNSTADQATAYITATGNVYTNTSGSNDSGGGGTAFTKPPYTYPADATAGLQAAVQAGAGPK